MSDYSFKRYQSLSLRLWHWANSVVILGLLGTVLLRKTFLSWRTNSALIEEKLKAAGQPITSQLAKEIAVAIRDPLWDWHIYLGFALVALFLARVLMAVLVENSGLGFYALKTALGIKDLPTEERRHALHFTIVKIGYAVFYAVTALMVLTGLLLYFKTELGLSKEFAGFSKEIHELLMWFFVLFICGHLLGIVVAENRADQGITSDMIHGGDPKKKP